MVGSGLCLSNCQAAELNKILACSFLLQCFLNWTCRVPRNIIQTEALPWLEGCTGGNGWNWKELKNLLAGVAGDGEGRIMLATLPAAGKREPHASLLQDHDSSSGPRAGVVMSAWDGKHMQCSAAQCSTYANREHWPSLVYGIAVPPRTDVCQVFPITCQSQLLVHELGKCPHPVWAATNADKLDVKHECVGIS